MPFRKELPKASLVSLEDTRCICPDTTHMIIRCFEADFREMAQKLTDDMHPHKKVATQHFEENLTSRVTTRVTDRAGKVAAVTFSGICALTSIADKEQMKGASTETEDLFEGVWKNKVLVCPKKIQLRALSL